MTDILDLEIRRKIYDLILKNPGLHALKISKLLCISSQLADYHLGYLERYDIIIVVKEGGFRRYYVKGTLGFKERRRISILRHETLLRIVLFLLKNPNSTYTQLLDHLQIVKSTLSYHLSKLIKNGLVQVSTEHVENTYCVSDEKEIIELLVKYKPYYRTEGFTDAWADLEWPGLSKTEEDEPQK